MEPTTYQKESDLAGMVEFIYQKLIEEEKNHPKNLLSLRF